MLLLVKVQVLASKYSQLGTVPKAKHIYYAEWPHFTIIIIIGLQLLMQLVKSGLILITGTFQSVFSFVLFCFLHNIFVFARPN